MGPKLEDLLHNTITIFDKHNIEYFLHYGTLLGMWRDNIIIPWEFDLDYGVPQADCEKIVGLKEEFKREFGYTVYGPNDYIASKASYITGNGDGYLHSPCARVYNKDELYVDLYGFQVITPENIDEFAQGRSLILPPAWDRKAPLYCCNEVFWVDGGCSLLDDVLPLQKVHFLGMDVKIPAHPEPVLEDSFGKGWTVPQPKGYKVLVCSWAPSKSTLLILIFIAIPAALFYLYQQKKKNTKPRYSRLANIEL